MSKRVLIYCPEFLPVQTGYSHAFAALTTNLLNEGYEVDVLVTKEYNGDELIKHERLHIIRKTFALKVWFIGLFYHYFVLARYIFKRNKQNNYQVIFIETGDHPLLIAFLREQLLHKVVVRFHSTSDTEYLVFGKHFKYKLKCFFWKAFASARIKNLCATSEYHLEYAAKNIVGHRGFNYYGTITNTIVPVNVPVKTGSPERMFFMLGRMDDEGYKQKGFDTLLDAIPLVANEFEATGSRLIIVGDGTRHEFFRSRVSSYSFVELHKSMPHDEVKKLLNETDIVLLPSLYEGVSMFALEAIGYGKAVVFGKTGGLIDMVQGNGVLVEPGNSVELANAISSLIKTGNLEALKENSITVACQLFSAEQQMKQFDEMLKIVSC